MRTSALALIHTAIVLLTGPWCAHFSDILEVSFGESYPDATPTAATV